MKQEMNDRPDIGWAILELMGHRKMAGYIREVELAGAPFIRIDVFGAPPTDPAANEVAIATQFYAPAALYAITPTTESLCRQLAKAYQVAPVARWELGPAQEENEL